MGTFEIRKLKLKLELKLSNMYGYENLLHYRIAVSYQPF